MTQPPIPFDPLEFLALARTLTDLGENEANLRTAVGRAYYAVFLVARQRTGVSAASGSAHGDVVRALSAHDRALADQLGRLRRLRNVADYELVPITTVDRNRAKNWHEIDTLAGHMLPRVLSI
jgi:hypothetical protein